MFSCFEVLSLHRLLRILDAAADELRFNRYAFGHSQAEHQSLHAVAAKNAQQVVFKRQEETRSSRISLAARASSQLIVNPSRFVPLGSKDM